MKGWFRHDIRSLLDDKLFALVLKFGAEGYGVWWAIVEAMYDNDGQPLSSLTFKRIAKDLSVEYSKVLEVAEYAASSDCNFLFAETDAGFVSERVQEECENYEGVKQKRIASAQSRWATKKQNQSNSDANAMQVHSKCNASAMQVHSKCNANAEQMQCTCNADKIRLDNITLHDNNTVSNTNVLSTFFCGEAKNSLPAEGENQGVSEPVFDELPVLGGGVYKVTESQIAKWQDAYPAINVKQQVKAAHSWLDANKTNQKKDIKRFLNNWLNRSQDRARPVAGSDNAIKGTDISMTFRPSSLDAENFSEEESFNEMFDKRRKVKK